MSNQKESGLLSDLFLIVILALLVHRGMGWIDEYQTFGQVTLPKEMTTLYGQDAMLTAYLTTSATVIGLIYAVFLIGRKWLRKI